MTRPERLPDQWYSRDLLVLREIARAFADDPSAQVRVELLAEAMQLDLVTTSAVTGTLRDAGFISGKEVQQLPGLAVVTDLTPAGRREVGLWPSPDTAADRLMAALDLAIDRAQGEQRTWLQKFRAGARGVSRDVLVDLIAAVLARQIGA